MEFKQNISKVIKNRPLANFFVRCAEKEFGKHTELNEAKNLSPKLKDEMPSSKNVEKRKRNVEEDSSEISKSDSKELLDKITNIFNLIEEKHENTDVSDNDIEVKIEEVKIEKR